MPYDTIEGLVIEALRKLTQGKQPVSPDRLIADVATTSGVPGEAVIRAIWRLADLDEIEFRDGRLLTIGERARRTGTHASAA